MESAFCGGSLTCVISDTIMAKIFPLSLNDWSLVLVEKASLLFFNVKSWLISNRLLYKIHERKINKQKKKKLLRFHTDKLLLDHSVYSQICDRIIIPQYENISLWGILVMKSSNLWNRRCQVNRWSPDSDSLRCSADIAVSHLHTILHVPETKWHYPPLMIFDFHLFLGS